MKNEKEIGKIFKFFSKISVAAVEVTNDSLAIGDAIHIKGSTTDFEQEVESMQIDGEDIDVVVAGKSAGLKVVDKIRPGDKVYKVL